MTKYPLVDIYLPSIITIPSKTVVKIKANNKIRRRIVFTYPEKETPEFLMIDKELCALDVAYPTSTK